VNAADQNSTISPQTTVNQFAAAGTPVVGTQEDRKLNIGTPSNKGNAYRHEASGGAFVSLQENNGTGSIPFWAVEEKIFGTTMTDQYQTITVLDPYRAFSFEELRLVDYVRAKKFVVCKPAKRGYRPNDPLVDGMPITPHVRKLPDTGHKFVVMRQYLVFVSPHFERTLNAPSGAKPDIIILEDVAPAIFGIFHEWLLSRKLLNRNCKEFSCTDGYADILHTYVFAHKYDVPQLRRDAIDAFGRMKTMRRYLPSPDVISTAYAELPETSPMVSLVLDMYATTWGPDADGTENNPSTLDAKLPKRFFIDLAVNARRRMVSGKMDWVWKPCDYHHE
jgi:hypothetical protein